MVAFINLASRHKDWPNLLGWMDEYLTRFEQHATKIRLNKARVQAVALNTPIAARKTLDSLRPAKLTPTERELFYRIVKGTRRQTSEEKAITGKEEIEFATRQRRK